MILHNCHSNKSVEYKLSFLLSNTVVSELGKALKAVYVLCGGILLFYICVTLVWSAWMLGHELITLTHTIYLTICSIVFCYTGCYGTLVLLFISFKRCMKLSILTWTVTFTELYLLTFVSKHNVSHDPCLCGWPHTYQQGVNTLGFRLTNQSKAYDLV